MTGSLRGGALAWTLALAAAFCLSWSTRVAAQAPPQADGSEEWSYAVRPGDNLWTISRQHLRSVSYWEKLQSLNRITDPLRLMPGETLRIPFAWMKSEPAAATVIASSGRVELTRAASTQPLSAGTEIRPGDVVATGADGSLTIEFADASRMTLEANARVVFDVLSAFGRTGMVDTRVRLERGRANTKVTPRRGRFRIWSPAAATVVRGTEFRAEFDDGARVGRAEVIEGLVSLVGGDTSVAVPEGFGALAQPDQPPSPPRRLLGPPALGAQPLLARSLPVTIVVPALAGAVTYRLDVAPDDRFQGLLLQASSTTGTFTTAALADGTYAVRVRGVDEHGLQGVDALGQLTVDARPEPPVAIDPQNGAVVGDERPVFAWARSEGASGYQFQLAREADRGSPIVDAATSASGFTPAEPLPPGEYAWRVATRASDGELGPFGRWLSLTRRQRQPGPAAGQQREEAGRLWLGWTEGPEGCRYRVQIARDQAFGDLVVDRVVATPQLDLDRPAPGSYHLRIRTIEADGFEGDFSPAQSFEVTAPPPAPPPPSRRSWQEFILPAITVVVSLLAL